MSEVETIAPNDRRCYVKKINEVSQLNYFIHLTETDFFFFLSDYMSHIQCERIAHKTKSNLNLKKFKLGVFPKSCSRAFMRRLLTDPVKTMLNLLFKETFL